MSATRTRHLYPARLHVNTTEKQKSLIKQIADEKSVNYSVVVRDAIDYYLKNHPDIEKRDV